ncbi:helix-turn-helix domain-containing protein [Vibrio crassostreae]|uniref:helix-turn-helix domain-containing protein n=1 Tax=Vibrio crassostreae TaxID=246167 RepID=UPI001B312C97|nr:helix-turn-helix transcriptional regulator [Vibrio crassostreae]CAK2308963.1 HTH cro/C1-type domain-containing protein [Vibrio crassostreae]
MSLLNKLDKEMKRSEIAKVLKCRESALSKWFSGKNTPSSQHIIPLSRLIGVSADELLLDIFPEQKGGSKQ